MKYAKDTGVSVQRSRMEIERILTRWQASRFAYGTWEKGAIIPFQYGDKQIRFQLPLPDRSAKEFWYTPTRHTQRTQEAANAAWEKACRQRWRALALSIKAKRESVETGIESFETAFMPYVVLPDGKTVAEHVLPALAQNQLAALKF
jgi:2-polyprenyl-6-methoxyphenol hydroxylase-like FAD-dependent oxidoreductase